MTRLICVLIIGLLLWPLPLLAATLDNSCSGSTNSGTSTSCTFTIGSLTNGVLYIYTADNNTSDTQTTPTVNGSSTGVTAVTTQFQDVGTNHPSKLWVLTAPASGSTTVQFTASSASLAIAAITYSGVDQSTPNRTVGKTRGNSTSPSVSATTVSGDTVAEFFAWFGGGVFTLSYDGSQTSRENRANNNQAIGISDETASGTSATASGTLTGTTIWAVIAVPLINATASARTLMLLGVGQ